MILQYRNDLYNLDGWKKITHEDGWCYILFSKTPIQEDEGYEDFGLSFKLVEDDYLYDFQRSHEDYDHKDMRQVRYRADEIIYKVILDEVVRETPYINLDKLVNVPKVIIKANKQYEKEWKDADDCND